MPGDNSVKYIPRLKETYRKVIVEEMMRTGNYKNYLSVPKLEKIVLNIGVSEARENPKAFEIATNELAMITGQKPKICRAKKSIAGFKIKKNMPIGLKVTLRGDRMYDFLDRLIFCALPRIKDFRGLNPKSFDGRGNYNIGLTEQYVFPEVDIDKSDKPRGMNITVATTANTDDEAKKLLTLLGLPFKRR